MLAQTNYSTFVCHVLLGCGVGVLWQAPDLLHTHWGQAAVWAVIFFENNPFGVITRTFTDSMYPLVLMSVASTAFWWVLDLLVGCCSISLISTLSSSKFLLYWIISLCSGHSIHHCICIGNCKPLSHILPFHMIHSLISFFPFFGIHLQYNFFSNDSLLFKIFSLYELQLKLFTWQRCSNLINW